MNFSTTMALVVTTACALGVNLPAQEKIPPPTVEIVEGRLAEVNASIGEMTLAGKALHLKIDSRTAAIKNLKSNAKLNYLEHRNLERLLQESQDLSGQISQLDLQIRRLRGASNQLATELLRHYETEISRQLKMLSNKQLTKAARDSSYRRLERLRHKRDQLQQDLRRGRDEPRPILELRIEQNDTPKRIRLKADLLSDQEDKQRRFSERVGKRINELQKEVDLRNRIDEFVTDLSLFDQQEETLGNVENNASASRETADEFSGIDVSSQQEAFVLTDRQDFSFTSLSEGELEDIIMQLRQQQTLAKFRADSLARQADNFNKAADNFKK